LARRPSSCELALPIAVVSVLRIATAINGAC
jgi:hypothetical protein